MKNILTILLLSISCAVYSQVASLNYLLNHNCETNLYEVKIKVLEGSATSTLERSQFNSQISILVPTGLDFEIVERFNPIQNNQTYTGTTPCEWSSFTPVISPSELPESDFHAIAPNLSPASFYNNLNTGDEVILFTCKIGEDTVYNPEIRFYDNDTDPAIQSSGSDFDNGFAIGSPMQLYNTNEYASCLSDVEESNIRIRVFPNPFVDQLLIESEYRITSLQLTDAQGSVHFIFSDIDDNKVKIPTDSLASGVYNVICESVEGTKVLRVVKM
jgi:hypothetical protein